MAGMTLRKLLLPLALICVSMHAQHVPSAVTTDEVPDKAFPATTDTFLLPSHGLQLNALVYVASGAGPHPIVILLHGFPGNEKNFDVAQSIRRAGWDVVYFNYRGSWGSPGDFSFTHATEDAQAAVDYLRDATNAKRLRGDAKNIVLMGHSMGGMIAANVGARDAGIRAVGLISAANMAGRLLPAAKAGKGEAAIAPTATQLASNGLAPLAGCTAESLARDLLAHAAEWNIPDLAAQLAPRPVLVVSSDDGLEPPTDELIVNLHTLKDSRVTGVHLATDHVYSGQRIALQSAVVNWLATLN
jgi:pimeloyl-ACP methyl ester carboxylesterase